MDFLPGLIHGAIELMFLDPLPSILSDRTHFQFGLTFRVQLRFERLSPSCGVFVRACRHGLIPLWAALTPNAGPTSITLTDRFLSVHNKYYLSASAGVAEQLINTKHFPYRTSSLNVELTPVSVRCQRGAIYPRLTDGTWDRLGPALRCTVR